jgi:valyl-tRNA synthetase
MEWLKILLGPAITLLICFGGVLVSWGRVKQMIDLNQKRMDEVEDMQSKVVMKSDCEKQSEKCRQALCAKISEVKDGVKDLRALVVELHEKQSQRITELDHRREQAKDNYAQDFQKIIAFMARVEELLNQERYKTESRKKIN